MTDTPGNGRDIRMVPIRLGDVLMLMEVLRLGANTAMINSQRDAEVRLREYQKLFDDMVPTAARIFDGEVWAEINIALMQATSFTVFVQPRHERRYYWSNKFSGWLVIQVGDRSWRSKNSDIENGGEQMAAVIEVLEGLAPLDCLHMPKAELPEAS